MRPKPREHSFRCHDLKKVLIIRPLQAIAVLYLERFDFTKRTYIRNQRRNTCLDQRTSNPSGEFPLGRIRVRVSQFVASWYSFDLSIRFWHRCEFVARNNPFFQSYAHNFWNLLISGEFGGNCVYNRIKLNKSLLSCVTQLSPFPFSNFEFWRSVIASCTLPVAGLKIIV